MHSTLYSFHVCQCSTLAMLLFCNWLFCTLLYSQLSEQDHAAQRKFDTLQWWCRVQTDSSKCTEAVSPVDANAGWLDQICTSHQCGVLCRPPSGKSASKLLPSSVLTTTSKTGFALQHMRSTLVQTIQYCRSLEACSVCKYTVTVEHDNCIVQLPNGLRVWQTPMKSTMLGCR